MAAGGKFRVLAIYFSKQNWYVFWESKWRGESDLSPCTILGLLETMPLRNADLRQILRPNTFWIGSRHRAAAFFLQVAKLCTHLDRTLLYIFILGTYSKFAWENKMLALGACFLQPCPSAGRWLTTDRSRLLFLEFLDAFLPTKLSKTALLTKLLFLGR